jgi:Zn finger protein HypA/HybF involved in hydrogenase expression
MATFHELCAFPCLCRDCKRIVDANLLDAPASCPDCKNANVVPYDHEELCEDRGEVTVTSWSLDEHLGRELVLTDGTYYCPSCDSFRLRFEDTGLCWD